MPCPYLAHESLALQLDGVAQDADTLEKVASVERRFVIEGTHFVSTDRKALMGQTMKA